MIFGGNIVLQVRKKDPRRAVRLNSKGICVNKFCKQCPRFVSNVKFWDKTTNVCCWDDSFIKNYSCLVNTDDMTSEECQKNIKNRLMIGKPLKEAVRIFCSDISTNQQILLFC